MRDEKYYTKIEDTEKCWFKKQCSCYGTEVCTKMCKRLTQTNYMLCLSNLPKNKQKPQNLNIDFLDPAPKQYIETLLSDVERFVRAGYSVYFYGETGTGKTSWAVKIMTQYFTVMSAKNDFRCRGLYISVPSFLRDAKIHMTYKTEEYMELLQEIKKCDVVIWDDIFQTDPTAYESQWLYSFINDRLFAGLCNIFTSNLVPDELKKADERLYSRICSAGDMVEISGRDCRGHKSILNW